jgi:hypothetical protein
MPVLEDWTLSIDVDAVLRGQGADPGLIRDRNPLLVEAAQRAIQEAQPLLAPRVLYQRFPVEELRHEQLHLHGGHRLQGQLLAQHLGGASEVILLLCTIGAALENYASEISKEDMPYGLSLDGFGSAAVETLANAACAYFDEGVQTAGLQTSIPLSPGMLGWSVEQGQPQIFSILNPAEIGVHLTSSLVMIPRKSLAFILGIGDQMLESASACEFCSLKETCRYQDHYV